VFDCIHVSCLLAQITFKLPDGKTLTAPFPSTQTVGFLKAHLVRHLDYVYDFIELRTETMELPDPFSLIDVGIGPGSKKELTVLITGEIDPHLLDEEVAVGDEREEAEYKGDEVGDDDVQDTPTPAADEYSDDFDTFDED